MRHVGSALLGVLIAAAAGAVALPELLARIAAGARAPAPLRADGRLALAGGVAHPIVLLARGGAVYVEVRDGVRALVRPDRIDVAGGGDASAPLAGSDLRLEDLRPFAADSLRFPQVSDEGPDRVVVTGAPARPSAYALLVHTIDPARAVVVATQYYAGTVSNLVKRRHDGGWTPRRRSPARRVPARSRPTAETFFSTLKIELAHEAAG
jgi:hypothetical protein